MLFLLCLILVPLLSAAKRHDWYHRNKATIQTIYNRGSILFRLISLSHLCWPVTLFPANTVIIAGGAAAVPPGLFNANATGRVTPVGQFTGFQDSIEYFFGLAPVPNGVPPNGAQTNATLVEFTSPCPEVASSTVYLAYHTINPDNSTGAYLTTLKEVRIPRLLRGRRRTEATAILDGILALRYHGGRAQIRRVDSEPR